MLTKVPMEFQAEAAWFYPIQKYIFGHSICSAQHIHHVDCLKKSMIHIGTSLRMFCRDLLTYETLRKFNCWAKFMRRHLT